MPTALTKLQAVNSILDGIGSSPVNALDPMPTIDGLRSLNVLDEVLLEVQTDSWKFNTQVKYALVRNADNEIVIPDNVLAVDVDDVPGLDVVPRGGRLFNLTTGTYKFTADLSADVVLALDWEELPQHVRNYIRVRALRKLANRSGDPAASMQLTLRDEQEAMATFKRLEGWIEDSNFLKHDRTYSPVSRRTL